ncbi:hypothetical protein CPB83DRAFT_849419 [Crepidotus variabilis]|uniref:Uncharacterized protein n=1 Tax=Crepidotus variabilis TaxID=179855 RepID=A0A9P6JRS3_9AGAR|nr:hypothetical protein CPB83DRAFT_849419 [Crepidotus variabilis]
MKFFSPTTIFLVASLMGVATAAPVPVPVPAPVPDLETLVARADSATYMGEWPENGLQRYRYATNVADKLRFFHAFQKCGGITSNWQAWDENGHGVFDVSEVQGFAGSSIISCGIRAVTGKNG